MVCTLLNLHHTMKRLYCILKVTNKNNHFWEKGTTALYLNDYSTAQISSLTPIPKPHITKKCRMFVLF